MAINCDHLIPEYWVQWTPGNINGSLYKNALIAFQDEGHSSMT
jgi:hypothetical protein